MFRTPGLSGSCSGSGDQAGGWCSLPEKSSDRQQMTRPSNTILSKEVQLQAPAPAGRGESRNQGCGKTGVKSGRVHLAIGRQLGAWVSKLRVLAWKALGVDSGASQEGLRRKEGLGINVEGLQPLQFK